MKGNSALTGSGPRALPAVFAANVLFGSGLFFHAFLYNFYVERLGLSEVVMGGAAAALTAGGLVALLPAGLAVDRWGGRPTFLVGSAAATAGLLAGAFAERPLPIYLAALCAGGGTVAWRVATGPILMQLTTPAIRSRAFSWNVGLLVGSGALWMALAGSSTQWMETLWGLSRLGALRTALSIGALGTAIGGSLFAIGVRLPSAAVRRAATTGVLPDSGTLPRRVPATLAILVLLVAIWMMAPALVTPFFNIYFSRAHGLDIGRIGLIFAATHAVTAGIVFGSGEVASRLGPRLTLVAWMVIFAPAVWGLAATGGVAVAVALYLLQGFVSPATNPLIDQILLERAPVERQGAVSSWRNAATELSGVVGASAGGLLLRIGSFSVLFATAGAVGILAAAVLAAALKRYGTR